MGLFKKKKNSGPEFSNRPDTESAAPLEEKKKGFSLFGKKKDKAPKEVKEEPKKEATARGGIFGKKTEPAQGAEEDVAYVEKMFTVPYIQCIPDSWCRAYLVDRVSGQINRQVKGTVSRFAAIFIVVLVVAIGMVFLSRYTDRRITSYLKDTNLVLENYSEEIKNAISLGGVLTFVHDIPVHEQYKGIVKNLAESAVIAHEVRFNHNQNEIPNNVKNNFEAQNAMQFDRVRITGIWFVDCSYLSQSADQGGEQWILEINKKFQDLYKAYDTNVYVDMVTRNYSASRDDMNRGELVIVFWK